MTLITKASSHYCDYKKKRLPDTNNKSAENGRQYELEKHLFTKQLDFVLSNPGLHSGNFRKHSLSNAFLTVVPNIEKITKFAAGNASVSTKNHVSANVPVNIENNDLCCIINEAACSKKIWKGNSKNLQSHRKKKPYRANDKNKCVGKWNSANKKIQEVQHDTKSNKPVLTSENFSGYEPETSKTGEDGFFDRLFSGIKIFPGVDAGVIKSSENSIPKTACKNKLIFNDNEKKNFLHKLEDRFVSSELLADQDKNNFEYVTRVISADEPLAYSGFKYPDVNFLSIEGKEYQATDLLDDNSEKIVGFSEKEFLSANGETKGRVLLIKNQRPVVKTEMKGILSDRDIGPQRESGELITLGISPITAGFIANIERQKFIKNPDKFGCADPSVSKKYVASLANFSANGEKFLLQETPANKSKPANLKDVLPLPERAAFYSRDPLTGVRTEILIRLHKQKDDNKDVDNFYYLKPTDKENEFYIYQFEGHRLERMEKKVIYNVETQSWRYADSPQQEKIEVDIVEGNKQVNLYGDYYNAKLNGEGNYIVHFYKENGLKEYIPVYREPLSKKWSTGKSNNQATFDYSQEALIEKISIPESDDYSYFALGNNDPEYYGKGNIYEKVYKNRDVNDDLGRFVEMSGKIVPVRNKKHAGHGVLYEVYDVKNAQLPGYAIEWDGERWLFEKPTSAHISDELKEIITTDMYVSNLDESMLSSPNSEGLRTDKYDNKYIRVNNGFISINQDENKFFIRKPAGDDIFLNFIEGKFFPANSAADKGKKIIKRDLKSDCPSWSTQYDELGKISQKNEVITIRHRGDSDTNVAENSLSAFRLSYKNCRSAIETDVLLTKDNQAVIFHDVRIGKMMEPGYDPERNTGPNAFLKDMTLDELKNKKLLDPRRRPTEDTIITVDELIRDYRQQNGQSLLYLEVKDPQLIMRVAKTITDEAKYDPTLLKRIIVKFNMAEFPTYVDWVAGLKNAGADINIMANPVMSPAAAARINKLPNNAIPIPPGDPLHDNASRAVWWWSHAYGQNVPNVEIVIKSSDSGFINKVRKSSPQGDYLEPVSLDIANTVPGSPAYFIAIVKKNHKPLGTYVPAPDRIMWRDGFISGITVPDTAQPHKRSDIVDSYYNNDSRCCYTLEDRLAENEHEDVRANIAWNRGIGANVITSDDIDSIDTFLDKARALDRVAIPHPKYPKQEMQSKLAWELKYWPAPDGSSARFKGWGGGSAKLFWGGQVCIYDNPYTKYPWVYQCDVTPPFGYKNELNMRVVKNEKYGAVNQILSHDKKFCMSGKDGDSSYMKWTTDCSAENTETHFWYTEYEHLRNLYADDNIKYAQFYRGGIYYGQAYGLLSNTNTPDDWAEWKLEKVD
ncbi:glycerophosphodiester phosphodiesterase family protein [Erwinia psidii]|uniref:GP-PDE domain-containing protein n=1 Tax=Erwinia psidii TaxID=69224 RepID=A0A3N6SMK4_9GAMM|nr:glycerophosphodiester phosphodiesterase family protein [Erwinia psidii]RQM40111.1 hypothetical protein EB241_02120 [Erwinia psidii]